MADQEQTHRIEIPDEFGGGWVDIHARRTLAAKREVESAAIVVGANGSPASIDLMRQGRALALASIVAWSLEDGPDTPLPVAKIGEVDDDLGEFILEAIDSYYASRRRTKSGADAAGASA